MTDLEISCAYMAYMYAPVFLPERPGMRDLPLRVRGPPNLHMSFQISPFILSGLCVRPEINQEYVWRTYKLNLVEMKPRPFDFLYTPEHDSFYLY